MTCCLALVACGNPFPPIEVAEGGAAGTSGSPSGVAGSPATSGATSAGGVAAGGTATSNTAGSSAGGGAAGASVSAGGSTTAGAGGASAGAGGTGPAGCPTSAAFCDDFEAGSALGAAWTVDNTLGATVSVVNSFTTMPGPTMAHSGKNAVQIGFPAKSGYAMIVEKAGFPAPVGYWGRVWMFVETPASDNGHTVYIEGSTGMDLQNHGARPLNTQGGKMAINIDPVGNGEAGANSPTAIPRGAWTCFEWQISATGGSGDVVLYVDGAMMPVASLKAKPIEALVEQRVGYERYAAGGAGNLWIDDYAIGAMRLGCM
ncbi:MAG TPA: hypothetical protein VHP33_40480 [Polyangiaceae bacterium]|nr:hypothetical protein [Polyangiaceae bacterium]